MNDDIPTMFNTNAMMKDCRVQRKEINVIKIIRINKPEGHIETSTKIDVIIIMVEIVTEITMFNTNKNKTTKIMINQNKIKTQKIN